MYNIIIITTILVITYKDYISHLPMLVTQFMKEQSAKFLKQLLSASVDRIPADCFTKKYAYTLLSSTSLYVRV